VAVVLAATVAGFALLQRPCRELETYAVAGLLQLAGADETRVLSGTYIEIFPAGHGSLLAYVTPACSALSSLLAITALAVAGRHRPTRRWWLALVAALATIALGNVLRMTVSLAVGLEAGEPALVAFHDWVGGTFAFAYTLFGYILFLYLVLPRSRRDRPAYDSVA
jgi:carbamoyl-phosphate synthase large subunit